MNNCYHCAGTVLFSFWRLSVTSCDWGCGEIHFRWLHRDGITRAFFKLEGAG